MHGNSYNWELTGPGDAGQVTSLNVLNNGDIVAGFDIRGIYLRFDNGIYKNPSLLGYHVLQEITALRSITKLNRFNNNEENIC